MYLLDTCVLLWLAADQHSLSEKVIEILSSHPSGLFISAISAFEIGVKSAKGKLDYSFYYQYLSH
jgi:PIN domain nuclease of toxin-antitoxin system